MKYLICILTLICIIGIAIFIYALLIEPKSIETTVHDVNNLLHTESTDITFVQITDLHIKNFGKFEKTIANRIRHINPDFIVFTGDIIDSNNKFNELESFLKSLPLKTEKFAVLGNWEHWGNIDIKKLSNLYSKYNCKLLINSSAVYSKNNDMIQIIGIDDATAGTPLLAKALNNVDLNKNHILLSHTPAFRDKIIEYNYYNIKLMLSGHSHGGQIRVFGKSPFLPQGTGKYVKGWFNNLFPHLYVSKGLGTSILPLRIGAKPEIAVFKIKCKS